MTEDKSKEESSNQESEEVAEGEEDASMEDILKSIRGVISGEEEAKNSEEDISDEDDDVLELTDMVEEEKTENQEPAAEAEEPKAEEEVKAEPKEDSPEDKPSDVSELEEGSGDDDVLDDIDSLLSSAEGEEKPEEAVPEDNDVLESAPEDDILEAEPEPEVKEESVAEENVKEEKAVDLSSSSEELITDETADVSSETIKELVKSIPKDSVNSPRTRGGTTLEELTIEAMRPFLSEWLNENLPTIVKQLVSKEIKKLIPQDDDS